MSRSRPLWVWWALSQLAAMALPVALFLASGILGRELREVTWHSLEDQANLTAVYLSDAPGDAGALLRAARERTLSGFRLVDASGVVVASSGDNLGDDYSWDPAVQAALDGRPGRSTSPRERAHRYPKPGTASRWADERFRVAVPMDGGGALLVIRTPKEEVQVLLEAAPGLVAVALLSLLASLGLTVWVSRRLTRSLRTLDAWATDVADGRSSLKQVPQRRLSHVSEVRRLDASVRSMAREIEEQLSFERELAAHVAHEFRTPLTTLLGTMELLRGEMPPERRDRFMDNAEFEIRRLNGLLTDLLALARVGAEGERASVRPLGLARELAEDRDIEVGGEDVTVQGDPASLRMALDNLLSNAERHGQRPIQVQIHHAGDQVVVQVIDAGGGVPEADRGKVFERFFTTDRRQGTGLGLALVARVAAQHGGEARCVDGGVELRLPG